MDRERAVRELEHIKKLFYRPVIARKEGMVTHYGDCEVHRSVEMHNYAPCVCGLNYLLRTLDGIAEKINPDYGLEYRKQEVGVDFVPPTPKEYEERHKILEEVFGPFNELTPEEQAKIDEEEWSIIAEVFGDDYVEYLKEQVPDNQCEVCRIEWSSKRHGQCPWCREMGSGRTNCRIQCSEGGGGCCHSERADGPPASEEG